MSYKVVSIYKDSIGTTCGHCGRGIKNIAIVEDTLTKERMTVGLTCLDKLLNVKESFIDRVKKECKKYYTLSDKIEKLKIAIEQNKDDNEVEITWLIQTIIKLVSQIEIMNNLGTRGYIQLENIEILKNECNELCKANGYKIEY